MKSPHDRPGIASVLPLALTAGVFVFFCGCKSTQTTTSQRVLGPIDQKFSSNYDTSNGLATSETVTPYDGKKFESSKAFNAGDFSTDEINPKNFEGLSNFKGSKDFEDNRSFATEESEFTGMKSKFSGRKSRFSDRELFDGAEVTDAGKESKGFSKMFRTKDVPNPRSEFSSFVEDSLTGAESVATDEPGEATVGDIRSLLNRN